MSERGKGRGNLRGGASGIEIEKGTGGVRAPYEAWMGGNIPRPGKRAISIHDLKTYDLSERI